MAERGDHKQAATATREANTKRAHTHTHTDTPRPPSATFRTHRRQPNRRMEKTLSKQQANNMGYNGYAVTHTHTHT